MLPADIAILELSPVAAMRSYAGTKPSATTSLYVVAFNDGYVPGNEQGEQDPIVPGAVGSSQSSMNEESSDSATIDQDRATDICGTYGASFTEVFTGLGGFSAQMTAGQAQSMATDPRVKSVEEDYAMDLPTTQTLSNDSGFGNWQWGLDAIDQTTGPRDMQYKYTNTGAGVNVFLVDSGVWSSHPDFGGRVTLEQNIGNAAQPAINNYGHGTWIASII